MNVFAIIVLYVLSHFISIEANTTLANTTEANTSVPSVTNSSVDSRGIAGLGKICLDTIPDGVAILTDTNTGDEILIIFKVSSFWVYPVNAFVGFTLEQAKTTNETNQALFSLDNQRSLKTEWPNFPRQLDYAVSFTDLGRNDTFFNNVLVFSGVELYRYRVVTLTANSFQVQFQSKHRTEHWPLLPPKKDIIYMAIVRQSTVIFVQGTDSLFKPTAEAYKMNKDNLDNPTHYVFVSTILPSPADKMRFYYTLGTNTALSFPLKGETCINSTCINTSRYFKCGAQAQIYRGSFAYWLWRDTDFTIRLFIITLCSVMIVNSVLALSFIYNQSMRIVDLT